MAWASWTVKQKQQQEPEAHRIAVPQPEMHHEARCARCRQHFRSGVPPWQDYCSHRFCDSCFDNLRNGHSLCPACKREGESYEVGSHNMHFRDQSFLRIRDLKAKCSFDPPCSWVGEFNQLNEHESFCENRKFCCHHCGARVIWRLMDDHVTTECRHRRVTCHYCQIEIKYSDIIEHVRNDCPFYNNPFHQHISNCTDEVKQGLWILQMVLYEELDSRRHLSIADNSNLVTNGIQVADETQDEVNVEKVEMGSSKGSAEAKKELAMERNDVENNVSNEHGDLVSETKTLVSANKVINVPVQKNEGNVELMQDTDKTIMLQMLEHRPNQGKENEEKREKEKLAHDENQAIIKSNNGSCRDDSIISGSRYLTNKHEVNSDETNFLASNKSTEPASQETKRKKKKNKKKKVDNKDGEENNSIIDSKVEQNVFHSIEVCCSKLKACQERVDVLESAMKVLMRELERQTNTNGLLVKLMRDQHNLEGRINAVEEKQNF